MQSGENNISIGVCYGNNIVTDEDKALQALNEEFPGAGSIQVIREKRTFSSIIKALFFKILKAICNLLKE